MFSYHKSDRNKDNEEIHVKALSDILSKYRWLTDSYNVDYFIDNHWLKIPKSWSQSLDCFDLKDIESLLSYKTPFKSSVLPLSLLSLRASSFAFQLSPKLSTDSEITLSKFNLELTKNFEIIDFVENKHKVSKSSKIKNEVLFRHIKLKKRHEISRISHLINEIMNFVPNCNSIVDCGSGVGHLSRILSLCFDYKVISIEANSLNTSSAVNLDNRTLSSLLRYKLTDKTHSDCPKKVNYKLNKSSSVNEVMKVENYAIVGLHACGPLSHIILKQFANCCEAKALVLVSCCYMKDNDSFPLSQLVRSVLTHTISYEAKEVACHAIQKFVNKLRTGENLESLNVHCFRAILEALLEKFNPSMRHTAMKSVRIDAKMTFCEYYHKAVRGLNIIIPENELNSQYVFECLTQMKRVIVFYSLRLLIAPLIESLILIDFIIYLREKGISSALFPLFDPILSPRNNVLIAIKEDMNKTYL